ncbi:TetR family transcriptional regulator [Pedobacter quisquiliarum]|uniref:TetR family transcriptional regulator n=1 Tax=Pedobacter quisquiliarum TaxID=1834438 RepID=A0A916UDG7_9SPHI|nr:TetR/AcrR family transcriptional regulator [Pedobacter quisquiliarum]GGC68982.1 TetR family transcriptional regulator [Pedobacter quisquiliarum]
MNVQLEDICGKRETVLNSTLALIRQYGFHGTPMSMIAKHAGVAAGTIYHYFESKDALINALYEHESSRLAASLLVGDDEGLHYKERFFRCMLNHYHFYIGNPDTLYFLEQYSNSPYAKTQVENHEKRFEHIIRFFDYGIQQKYFKNIDAKLLMPIIKGTLVAAANFHLRQHMVFSDDDIRAVISMIWDGIKKQEKD